MIQTRQELEQCIQYCANANLKLIIYVTATWCKPCKHAKPIVLNQLNQLTQEHRRTIKFIELDFDECRSAVNFLKVRSVPTLVYYLKGQKENVAISSCESIITKFFCDI